VSIKYKDFIEKTFDFPQEEFEVKDDNLFFQGLDLLKIIEEHGSPLKIWYLPKIGQNINRAKDYFKKAMEKVNYRGDYTYCYCTKSSHFKFVLESVIESGSHLETSSAYDLEIIKKLVSHQKYSKDKYILFNGYKTEAYIKNIADLFNQGFENGVMVIDSTTEFDKIDKLVGHPFKIGMRIATEEEPKFGFYTSRLGIGYQDAVNYYKENLQGNEKHQLKLLHFFVNSGFSDTTYFWNELTKVVNLYCELKSICPELDTLDLGGGLPIKNSLKFDFNYQKMIDETISYIKSICDEKGVLEPNIVTEFGSFTVGESALNIYQVIDQKKQNDREKWNMIDSSFMTTLPDTWALNKKFVMLPINQWGQSFEKVFLGGISCDSEDFYNSEQHVNAIYLPQYRPDKPLYIGFFNTGAYQEALSGFGGIKHCLTPAPKTLVLDVDITKNNKLSIHVFSEEQKASDMLSLLGY